MKNKYLNKFFCITMLSAMVLACPTGVRAADATETVAADGDFSALCQKTVSYGRTAGSDCLTVYKKPQCVRALWLFYVMVNSKKSYKNVNKK